MGGCNIDLLGHPERIVKHTSNPCRIQKYFGGVGRNVSEALGRLQVPTSLISVVGNDSDGKELIQHLKSFGVDTQQVLCSDKLPSCSFIAVNEPQTKELFIGMSDMLALSELTPARAFEALDSIGWHHIRLAILDANLSSQFLNKFLGAIPSDIQTWFMPVSVQKCSHGVEALKNGKFVFSSPNRLELESLSNHLGWKNSSQSLDVKQSYLSRASVLLDHGLHTCFATLGDQGVLIVSRDSFPGSREFGEYYWYEVPAVKFLPGSIKSTVGAGDSFVGGCVYALMTGRSLPEAARMGVRASALSLSSPSPISPLLAPESLSQTPLAPKL